MNQARWFWAVLEGNRPSLPRLEAWMLQCSKDELARFVAQYEELATALCDPSKGPVVNGVQYSEDDTTDLCNNIVAQGAGFYGRVRSNTLGLSAAAQLFSNGENAGLQWSTDVAHRAHHGYQHPAHLAAGVAQSRFGVDLEELIDGLERDE